MQPIYLHNNKTKIVMRQKHILVILLAFVASVLQAAQVNKNDALQKAERFVAGRQAAARGAAGQTMSLQTALDNPYFYVFNIGTDGGFVIVSGDDRTPEILGYSDAGRFDAQNIPTNMRAFLQGYADEIAHMPETATAASRGVGQKRAAARSSISPLVTTRWNQRAPYYNSTPTISGNHAVTGCVATAMAQLMNYHKYPTAPTTDIPGYTPTGDNAGPSVSTLSSTTFTWDLMHNEYDKNDVSSAAAEVAKLMKYCGASVEMNYGASSSGAVTSKIVYALTHYFDYDAGAKYVERTSYGYADWIDLIYNELAAGRPMVFGGQSTGGGHAFVCDGYDTDDFFHINWGWGGLSDGYFRLANLAPDTQGTGGSSSSDGYNLELGATIGVQRNIGTLSDDSKLTVRDMKIMINVVNGSAVTANSATYTRSNTSSNFQSPNNYLGVSSKFWNYTGSTQSFAYGWRLQKDGVAIMEHVASEGTSINNNSAKGPGQTIAFGAGLENGTYQIVAICKPSGSETWVECIDADKYYIEAVIDGLNLTMNVVRPADYNLSVTSVSGTEGLTFAMPQDVTVTISNTGEGDFHGDVTLSFMNGNTIYQKIGGSVLDIPAGSSRDMTVSVSPTVSGTIYLTVRQGTFTKGTVLSQTQVTIAGASGGEAMTLSNYTVNNDGSAIYGNTFRVSLDATNNATSDYKYGITANLYKLEEGNTGSLAYSKTDNEVIAPNVTKTVQFDFPGLEYGETYFCKVSWYSISGTSRTEHKSQVGFTYTITHGFVTVDADGNVTASAPSASVTIPSDAVAVDLRGQSTVTTVTPNSNPNCVYLLDGDATAPTGVTGTVVKGDAAETLSIVDGSNFSTPVAFQAAEATYTRTFTLPATAAGGWSTLIVPFDVDKVMVDGEEIDWFHSAEATNGRFWVRQFVSDGNGSVAFDYTDRIKANTPYIIAVPGNAWGEKWSLVGKPIVFKGTNKEVATAKAVSSGNHYKFMGTTTQTTQDDVYTLNEAGTTFVFGNATVTPFRAYFMAADMAYATSALEITSPSSQTTAIGQLPAAIVTPTSGAVYTLDGRRLKTAPKHGVFIMNGKKMVK